MNFRKLQFLLGLTAVVSGGVVQGGDPLPWALQEPGYVVEVFATDFQLPVNIAFVPEPGDGPDDPFFYVTELRGTIKTVTRSGDVLVYATDLLNYTPPTDFPGPGEQGLTGIAVHAPSGDLYVSMLYDSPEDPGTHYPRIERFTSLGGGRTAATQTTILDMAGEPQGQSHQVSNVTFGPDGKLYVHVGDGFMAPSALDLDSFRGKILRMELDGSPALDNPFYNAGDGINSEDYVFAYGLRNPFGGVWRAADGAHYEVENGPNIDRFARVSAGDNFGWDGSSSSMTTMALYNWNPAAAPVNIAYVQPETFGGSGFPIQKMDRAFISESGKTYFSGLPAVGKRIVEVAVDGDTVTGPTTLLEYAGSGKATLVALAAGPDGLYFSDFYRDQGAGSPIDPGANILRLRSTHVPRLELKLAGDDLIWDALPGVSEYDLIRGSLLRLRASRGDFRAIRDCMEDNVVSSTATDSDPVLFGGYWYLVRDITAQGTGSYESGGTGQMGLRDAEIEAADPSCP